MAMAVRRVAVDRAPMTAVAVAPNTAPGGVHPATVDHARANREMAGAAPVMAASAARVPVILLGTAGLTGNHGTIRG